MLGGKKRSDEIFTNCFSQGRKAVWGKSTKTQRKRLLDIVSMMDSFFSRLKEELEESALRSHQTLTPTPLSSRQAGGSHAFFNSPHSIIQPLSRLLRRGMNQSLRLASEHWLQLLRSIFRNLKVTANDIITHSGSLTTLLSVSESTNLSG